MMDGMAYRNCLVESLRTEHAYLLANREPTPEVVCALVQALALKIEVLEDRLRTAERARLEAEEMIQRMKQNALVDRMQRVMERANPGT